MSYVNFYLIAGGTGSADINAGSSIGAAQAAATTNGNWNSGTGVFTATGGTPFASTTTNDYASVYVDGATVTTFVGKVTTVTSSTSITIDVATIKYGTAPSTSATGRSCVINGSWNSEIVLAATGLGTTTVPQSTKINCKGNLSVAASRTISMAGATTTPLWFSGYNANPGDLDNDTTNTLAKPIWTFASTTAFTTSGNYQIWSSISVTGNRTTSTGFWTISGVPIRLVRCRVSNTSSNTSAVAIGTTNGTTLAYCYVSSPTTCASQGVIVAGGSNLVFDGCVVENGGLAGIDTGSGAATITRCVFLNNTGAGVLSSTGTPKILLSTFYNQTVDGIKWTGAPGSGSNVIGCLFVSGSNTMTNGINNASGTASSNVVRSCNDYFNVTNAEVGMGDNAAFFGQTESLTPVISSTNLTPKAGTNARNNGFPGILENETYSSFPDIGAVRHQDPAGMFLQ